MTREIAMKNYKIEIEIHEGKGGKLFFG